MNGDGVISNADVLVADNSFVYPYGTTEEFPAMRNSALAVLTDTAHDYMECSNKGDCDRTTGQCNCYDGYDGVACQRASCPGYPTVCSGHGVCLSISQLASMDNGNIYLLWDKNVTMGCSCDSGFFGPDCSLQTCAYGMDPLYLDDVTIPKYGTFDLAIVSTHAPISTPWFGKTDGSNADFYDSFSQSNPGHFAIRFFDNVGQPWLTDPIEAGSSCSVVVAALENLPNGIIPAGTVQCTQSVGNNLNEVTGWTVSYDSAHPLGSGHAYRISYRMAFWEAFTNYQANPNTVADNSAGANAADPNNLAAGAVTPYTIYSPFYNVSGQASTSVYLSGSIYRLKFTGNPGVFKQPQIEIYLDGNTRPTLASAGGGVTITKLWTDGQQGEYNDYFADHCDGVTANIRFSQGFVSGGVSSSTIKSAYSYLAGLTLAEANLLKACLGDSDGNPANNVEVYNWDYGSNQYPHFIKLVRSVPTYLDGGYYAALIYVSSVNCESGVYIGCFKLLNPFYPPDTLATDNYDIYTTNGVLAQATSGHRAVFDFGSPYIYTVNTTADVGFPGPHPGSLSANDGDVSCVSGVSTTVCVNKGDLITVLSPTQTGFNPPHINLYTAERIASNSPLYDVKAFYPTIGNTTNQYMGAKAFTNVISTDLSLNWGNSFDGEAEFYVYKFTPAANSTYNYVAECSNRGICSRTTGTCTCFPGYTSDACSVQNSLAL